MTAVAHHPDHPALRPAPAGTVPGPAGHPLFGSMLDFQKDRLGFILGVQREYGDVARYRVAHLTFYQISHPNGVQHILQDNNRNYVRGALYEPIRNMFGNGLPASEGDFWLRQRRLMQPAFHHQRLAAFGDVMTTATAAMLERWDGSARAGHPIDVAAEMAELTMEIVTQALFSNKVADATGAIGRAVTAVLQDISYRFDVPFYPPLAVPTPRNRRTRAATQYLDRIVYGLIEERGRAAADSPPDLLSLLVNARDEATGEGMSPKQLRDEVFALFIAGHETTANALAWAFALLSQHPDVERRLHAELAAVLGRRTPTLADLPRLPYARQVLDETMRLYPPAWIFNRTAVADDEIGGHRIPAGATIAWSPYVTHRHPDVWQNPEGFDPDRFAPERSSERPHCAYIPFGAGPHQCIGKGFALMEAQLVLATVLQRYRLDLVPGQSLEPLAQVTLRPRYGVKMRVCRRG